MINSNKSSFTFLDEFITGDEKWIIYDNVACKRQWVDKDISPQPDPNAELHDRKIMLCLWWDRRSIIHFEILNHNETVTTDLYILQLQHVKFF